MGQQRETKFKEKVVNKLKPLAPDVWFTKIQQMSKKGDPDFILCVRGKFEAWELKTEDGKATRLQEYTLDKVRQAQGVAIVVDPSNLDYHISRLTSKLLSD